MLDNHKKSGNILYMIQKQYCIRLIGIGCQTFNLNDMGSSPIYSTKLKKNSLHTFVILYSDMPIKLSCDDNKFLVNIDEPLV